DAVFADRDEYERVVDPAVRHAISTVLRRVCGTQCVGISYGEHETAERGGALEKLPPTDVGDDERRFRRDSIHGRSPVQLEGRVHAIAPLSPAARLIAARIRP